MPIQSKRKRKSGFETTDIKQKAFYGQNFERLKPVASPTHTYGTPAPGNGNAKALLYSLEQLTDSVPKLNKLMKVKGSEQFLRGETRPEGLLSLPQQEGWDYTEAQADEGVLYNMYDQGIKEQTAQWDGKNPEEFVKSIGKMSKEYLQQHIKGKSDAYLAGAQNSILKVTRDTDLAVQAIVQNRIAENGLSHIKSMTETRISDIYRDPKLSRDDKALAAKDVLTEFQKLGAEKYGLDKNAVTSAMNLTIKPSAAKNPALYEMFFVPDKDGIKPKSTPGGKGIEQSYITALEKAKDNIPTVAYDTLRGMPSFKSADGTYDYVKAAKFMDDPNNRKALGLETLTETNVVKAYMANAEAGEVREKAQVKAEYTTKTLNTAFDMIYKSSTQNTTSAIDYIKKSDMDGIVKHRVIKGLLTGSKTGSSRKFNTAMTDILEGRITHESAIYELMGHRNGVPIEEGKQLLTYFKLVNSPEIGAFKASRTEGIKVLTQGGIKIGSFSAVRQRAAKNFSIALADEVAKLQKEGKPVDWNTLTTKLIDQHKPTFQDELDMLKENSQTLKAGQNSMLKSNGASVTVSSGKDTRKVSPGLTTFEAFVADLAARESKKSGKPINAEGMAMMLADPAMRARLEALYKQYQIK